MASADRWPADAGPSVRFLGRVISGLLAGAVGLVAVYQLIDQVLGPPAGGWTSTLLMVSMLAVFIVRGLCGPLRAWDLGLLVAACAVDLVETAWSEATTLNLSTTVLSSLFVVAAPSVMRRRSAVLTGIGFVVLLSLAQAGVADQIGRQIVDIAVINVAFVFMLMVLVDLLHRAARVNDDLLTQMAQMQRRNQLVDSRRDFSGRAQRLIHDEVITALRVVADRAADDPQLARATCRRAVLAVRGFTESP